LVPADTHLPRDRELLHFRTGRVYMYEKSKQPQCQVRSSLKK